MRVVLSVRLYTTRCFMHGAGLAEVLGEILPCYHPYTHLYYERR